MVITLIYIHFVTQHAFDLIKRIDDFNQKCAEKYQPNLQTRYYYYGSVVDYWQLT